MKEKTDQHAEAFKATQSDDGRWHQLLNDTKSFRETSVTAMAITSLIRGVRLASRFAQEVLTSRFCHVLLRFCSRLAQFLLTFGSVFAQAWLTFVHVR